MRADRWGRCTRRDRRTAGAIVTVVLSFFLAVTAGATATGTRRDRRTAGASVTVVLSFFLAVTGGATATDDITEFYNDAVFFRGKRYGDELGGKVEKRQQASGADTPRAKHLHLANLLYAEWEERGSWRDSRQVGKSKWRDSQIGGGLYSSGGSRKASTENLENMRKRRMHNPPLSKHDGGQPNSTRPLLALIHPSSIGWPARLDVLVSSLTALESSTTNSPGEDFDIVVVLDSSGEHRSKHDCNAKTTAMMTPIPVENHQPKTFICDSAQFLEAGAVPFVISHSQGQSWSDKHKNAREPGSSSGEKKPSTLAEHVGGMRATAVRYAELYGYEHLVLVSSSTLIANGAVAQLSKAVAELESSGSVLAAVTPLLGCLSDVSSNDNSCADVAGLQSAYPSLPEHLVQFAEHPLNFQRTGRALALIWQRQPMAERLGRIAENDLAASALSLVAAFSTRTALALLSHQEGSLVLESGRLLSAGGVVSFVLPSAFAVARAPVGDGGGVGMNSRKADINGLLKNDVMPFQAALAYRQHPTGGSSRRSPTLVVATCAGVWTRTLSLILSLEGSQVDDFDFMLAVTPRDNDQSDAFTRAAGIPTLVQPKPIGLTDLWNLIVERGLTDGRKNLFIINNDVLIGDGGIASMVSALETGGADLVVPSTRFGAGQTNCPLYEQSERAKGKKAEFDSFISSPANYRRVQMELLNDHVVGDHLTARGVPTFMAFCFGLRLDWAKKHLLPDGRLWNNTRWKNYNQEKSLMESANPTVEAALNSFVYHFRGSTLEPGPCKNGWLDCATWQTGHRPDMASPWFKPDRDLEHPDKPWRDPRHDLDYTGK